LKVGMVIYGGLETLSGGYLYDRKLVEYLRQVGDSVELVSMPWKNYLHHVGYNFASGWAQRLANLDVDVLLQDELNHPSLFLLNGSLRKTATYPILSIVHHLRSSEEHSQPFQSFYRQVEQKYLHSMHGFIWNSQTTRKVVEEMLGKPCKGVVAYPAGDRLGTLSETEIMQRSRLPGPLRLLFVGNLIQRKGLHNLVSALASLKGAAWTLRVVGDPQVDPVYARKVYRQVQQAGLTDQVQFLGRLPEERLRDEWRCAQLLTVTSAYEGFGIVYLEGMGFGLPSIASRAGGAAEIIAPGINGSLVNPADPSQVTAAIKQYLGQPERLMDASLAARRRFAAFPTWEQTAQTIRQFLIDFRALFIGRTG
jgi:glycosyltransferase involved in cell wall biosynthesis